MPLYYGKNKIKDVGVSFKHKGGMNTSDATITSGAQMLNGVTAYGKDGKITGTIPSQQAKTITPNDAPQVAIQSGVYAGGAVIVSAVPTEVKNITTNGTYEPESGKYFSSVSVEIPSEVFETQSKNVSPTESVQTIVPDGEYDGLSSVTVEAISSTYVGSGITKKGDITITPTTSEQIAVSSGTYTTGDIKVGAISTETKNITSNGTYAPQSGKYFSSVVVDIPSEVFETQSKTVAPSESQQNVTPDSGYNGLSNVVVEAIPSNYVGSSVSRQATKTITPTKSVQTAIPANVYAEGAVTVEAIPSEYITTTDATAVASDIMSGKTAYVNGEKVTGTFTVDAEITAQDSIIAQIQSALEGKAAGSGGSAIKTCTINFFNDIIMTDNYTIELIVSTFDGLDVTKITTGEIAFLNQVTVNNIICGSVAVIRVYGRVGDFMVNIGDLSESLTGSSYIFAIPNEPDTSIDVSVSIG